MVRDKTLYKALRSVIDPELRESLVDLGLIYGVVRDGAMARVTMTLTTPYCPMAAEMQADIKKTLLEQPNVTAVEIEIVWSPVWDASTMATDEIKDKLGLW